MSEIARGFGYFSFQNNSHGQLFISELSEPFKPVIPINDYADKITTGISKEEKKRTSAARLHHSVVSRID